MPDFPLDLAAVRSVLEAIAGRPDAPCVVGEGTRFSAAPAVVLGVFGGQAIGLFHEDSDGDGLLWTVMYQRAEPWPYAGDTHVDGDLALMRRDLDALMRSGFDIMLM